MMMLAVSHQVTCKEWQLLQEQHLVRCTMGGQVQHREWAREVLRQHAGMQRARMSLVKEVKFSCDKASKGSAEDKVMRRESC